jgi:fluoride ion exporter CrcB/FEX
MKMNIYLYNDHTLSYESFSFWRLKHLFLLIGVITITVILSISLFHFGYETQREKAIK